MPGWQHSLAENLNRVCDCSVTDLPALRSFIEGAMEPGHSIAHSHPHLFSPTPVFLQANHVEEMRRVIDSIESIVQRPAYQHVVLETAPRVAGIDPRVAGVFMGFDFHITPSGPKLIEINTNAGGAFLNIAALDAHRNCCEAAVGCWSHQSGSTGPAAQIIAMFRREWRLARGGRELRSIAIVDEDPRSQYLYPEFKLAEQLFDSHGIRAHIVDPAELEVSGSELQYRGRPVDMVYNRLTDFYFAAPGNQAVRLAFERDLAVVTPHPRAHALYANKRNLVLLSDAVGLARLGVDAPTIERVTKAIPATRDVQGGEESWWRERKRWFFKPSHGFGSRGAYRGDKLTRRVFADVVQGEYLAQELIPASERRRSVGGKPEVFKTDIRCYVYDGTLQLMAARLYQGQTTNFRTAGGGFAPIYITGAGSP